MSLITDLFANALDEGYAEAAARQRAAGGPEPSGNRRRMSPALMAGLLGLGLLLATAALQNALDELEWQRWLEVSGRGYGFVADLARQVVARDMLTPGQHARLRARAGLSP